MRKKPPFQFLHAFILLFLASVHAQEENDMVVFSAPSEKFTPIILQAHDGLPRFGVLDDYISPKTGSNMQVRQVRGAQSPEDREKIGKVRKGLQNFSIMVELKYMEPFMGDLDRERLSTPTGNMSQELQNSVYLQNYLLNQVAPNICLDETCKNANKGRTEFERLCNYKTFMEECFGPLQKWSSDFFKNDELVGYHVSVVYVGNGYDFDKKGYWVNHYFNLNNVFAAKVGGTKRVIFEPVATYENELAKSLDARKGVQFFLKVDEATAERFMKEGKNSLYLVKKIKLTYSGKTMSQPREPMEFIYAHESKEVYIYEDIALTQHFATISLDNLTLKSK